MGHEDNARNDYLPPPPSRTDRKPQVRREQSEEEEEKRDDLNGQDKPTVIPATSQETGKKEVLPLLPHSLNPPLAALPWEQVGQQLGPSPTGPPPESGHRPPHEGLQEGKGSPMGEARDAQQVRQAEALRPARHVPCNVTL